MHLLPRLAIALCAPVAAFLVTLFWFRVLRISDVWFFFFVFSATSVSSEPVSPMWTVNAPIQGTRGGIARSPCGTGCMYAALGKVFVR